MKDKKEGYIITDSRSYTDVLVFPINIFNTLVLSSACRGSYGLFRHSSTVVCTEERQQMLCDISQVYEHTLKAFPHFPPYFSGSVDVTDVQNVALEIKLQ